MINPDITLLHFPAKNTATTKHRWQQRWSWRRRRWRGFTADATRREPQLDATSPKLRKSHLFTSTDTWPRGWMATWVHKHCIRVVTWSRVGLSGSPSHACIVTRQRGITAVAILWRTPAEGVKMEATPTTERIFLNIYREGEVLGRTEAGRMRVEERVTKDAQEQTGQG